MRTEVTMTNLWWNPSLMGFFFRDQAKGSLEELVNKSSELNESVLEKIEDYAEANDYDLDMIEEMFYEMSLGELAEEFEIELQEDDEDEEEDE